MAKKKMCKRCGEHPAVVNYCQPCMTYVSRAMDNVMENTRGAVCLQKSMPYLDEGTKVDWFLGIFHPGMSDEKVRAVVNDVRSNKRAAP
jgi:hypothetical protein